MPAIAIARTMCHHHQSPIDSRGQGPHAGCTLNHDCSFASQVGMCPAIPSQGLAITFSCSEEDDAVLKKVQDTRAPHYQLASKRDGSKDVINYLFSACSPGNLAPKPASNTSPRPSQHLPPNRHPRPGTCGLVSQGTMYLSPPAVPR